MGIKGIFVFVAGGKGKFVWGKYGDNNGVEDGVLWVYIFLFSVRVLYGTLYTLVVPLFAQSFSPRYTQRLIGVYFLF